MEGIRRMTVASGRELVIRPVRMDDAGQLSELYDRLSPDDRRLRFFGFYRPAPSFFERMASMDDGTGYRLVAECDGSILGEAGYSPLPNGDGEFAMVIDDTWRGWLGPYLLDALCEGAAARGVPNLEGDILVENTKMLALVRSRGYVTMDHQDCSVVRVLVATGRSMPTWPPRSTGYRLLVEVRGGRWRHEAALRRAGIAVLVCGGPGGRRTRRCPAMGGEPCPLASMADGVLVALPQPERQQMTGVHRRVHPDLPIVTEESVLELCDTAI